MLQALSNENAKVLCSRPILWIRQAMRITKSWWFHANLSCCFVHHLDKILWISTQLSSSPSRQSHTRIISTWKHQSIEQFLDCILVTFKKLCWSSTHISRLWVNSHNFFFWRKLTRADYFDNCIKSHDFGETRNLHNFFVVGASYNLTRRMFSHYEDFWFDMGKVFLSEIKKLFPFEWLSHFNWLIKPNLCFSH